MTRFAVDADATAVLFDQLLDRGESETGPETFRAEQRLEYPGQYVYRYSWSGISYGNFKLVGNPRRDGNLMLTRSRTLLDRVRGVIGQIDDHAPEPFRIEIDDAV